jgi:hypothetical protein
MKIKTKKYKKKLKSKMNILEIPGGILGSIIVPTHG